MGFQEELTFTSHTLFQTVATTMELFWEGSQLLSAALAGLHSLLGHSPVQSGEHQGEEPAKPAPGGGIDFYYETFPRGGC